MKITESYKLKYENLVEMFPCALFVLKDSVFIDCNKNALKILGYSSKDDILGRHPYELSPELQADGSSSFKKGQEIINRALNSDNETTFKWMLRKNNGDIFVVDVILYNLNSYLYAVVTDITEIEQLKEKTEGRNYLYRMLFDNHKTAILLIDPSTGRILDANQAAVNYYGYSKDKLISMNIKSINTLSPEQIDRELHMAESEKRSYFEFIHRLANGEEREVEVHSFPVAVDEKILLFSIINDMTDKLYKELMFNTLFLNSPYAVVILDKDQKIVDTNKYFTQMFQIEPDEAKQKYINQLVSLPEYQDQTDENIQQIFEGEIIRQEGIRRRKDGKQIYVEIIGYPVVKRNSIIGAYILYNDISEKKAYEEQLILFKRILENNSEGVVITDTDWNVEWINAAFQNITGFSLPEIKGLCLKKIKSGIQQPFYNIMSQLNDNGTWSSEIWNRTKAGKLYCEQLTISCIRDNQGKTTHYVGVFKDITEKIRTERRMAELQQKDTLTGLYNRDYFIKLVDESIRNSSENGHFSIIYIDIEDLKDINNSIGHHVGDKLMIELSERLQLMTNDKYVLSRYNGDEFAVLCTSKDIMAVADMILSIIKQPFIIENTVINASANIGISRFPDDGTDAEALIRHAETAMYKSKSHLERKIFLYASEMSEEIKERFHIANLLIRAVADGELSILYQPIFDINNPEKIVGTEALLRWNNPTLGNVVPDKFIPLAEKTGCIIYIGEWVLKQVCKQINLWRSTGLNIPVAVNISVKQLEQHKFAGKVIDITEKYNIRPDNIELEITESVSSGNLGVIVKNLKELKNAGFKISMDDFGKGFSSIGQIDRFELDKIKIDKMFIDDLLHITKKQNLVKSIIAMARSLNITVVAEGIESYDQLMYLREFGCQLGQGYLISRPLCPDEIENLLVMQTV